MAESADVGFAVATVVVVLVVGYYAMAVASVAGTRYVHLTLGVLWTGGNLLLGLVVGPALAALDDETAGRVYARMAPRLAFVLPALLVLVIGIGLPLSIGMHLFPHAAPWLAVMAFVDLTAVLVVFGWRFDAWADWRWRLPVGVVVLASIGGFFVTRSRFGMTLATMLLTLVVGSVILVVGLGWVLSGDAAATLEARRPTPDHTRIAAIGRRNAWLARVQILLQVVIIISVL